MGQVVPRLLVTLERLPYLEGSLDRYGDTALVEESPYDLGDLTGCRRRRSLNTARRAGTDVGQASDAAREVIVGAGLYSPLQNPTLQAAANTFPCHAYSVHGGRGVGPRPAGITRSVHIDGVAVCDGLKGRELKKEAVRILEVEATGGVKGSLLKRHGAT